MQISSTDYWLARFNFRFSRWMHRAGHVETAWLNSNLKSIVSRQPIYISGLARSGSTMLLELLSQHPALATHRYANFPFVATPWCWEMLSSRLTQNSGRSLRPRPHMDGIQIDLLSPESMEEPIWQAFFPWIHDAQELHRILPEQYDLKFQEFYQQHHAKMLYLRAKPRYLAKNNYHLTRLKYLLHIYPDACIIVPIRHPVDHTRSLAQQHALFCKYNQQQPRVAGYLQSAGHYEFGPQRVPIRLDSDSAALTIEHWAVGDEQLGYAVQWASLYGELHQFMERSPQHRRNFLIVRYEDFCESPALLFAQALDHCQLPQFKVDLSHIKPTIPSTDSATKAMLPKIEPITGNVAQQFGY